jgi:hypothetical protein
VGSADALQADSDTRPDLLEAHHPTDRPGHQPGRLGDSPTNHDIRHTIAVDVLQLQDDRRTVGPPDDWIDAATRDAQREAGRALLADRLVDAETMRQLQRQRHKERFTARPVPQDQPPSWAVPLAVPDGMTRTSGRLEVVDWVEPEWGELTEVFESPDGRRLRVTQTVPASRPSEGNHWVQITPDLRVQEMAVSPRDGSRAVFWSTRGRQLTVSVNAAALAELEPVVLALHEAATHHIPPRRRRGHSRHIQQRCRSARGLRRRRCPSPPWPGSPRSRRPRGPCLVSLVSEFDCRDPE